ncbi:unnamed protein product [Effrenium voratum]|nr:unnamed protein product [Effrenium voratum]
MADDILASLGLDSDESDVDSVDLAQLLPEERGASPVAASSIAEVRAVPAQADAVPKLHLGNPGPDPLLGELLGDSSDESSDLDIDELLLSDSPKAAASAPVPKVQFSQGPESDSASDGPKQLIDDSVADHRAVGRDASADSEIQQPQRVVDMHERTEQSAQDGSSDDQFAIERTRASGTDSVMQQAQQVVDVLEHTEQKAQDGFADNRPAAGQASGTQQPQQVVDVHERAEQRAHAGAGYQSAVDSTPASDMQPQRVTAAVEQWETRRPRPTVHQPQARSSSAKLLSPEKRDPRSRHAERPSPPVAPVRPELESGASGDPRQRETLADSVQEDEIQPGVKAESLWQEQIRLDISCEVLRALSCVKAKPEVFNAAEAELRQRVRLQEAAQREAAELRAQAEGASVETLLHQLGMELEPGREGELRARLQREARLLHGRLLADIAARAKAEAKARLAEEAARRSDAERWRRTAKASLEIRKHLHPAVPAVRPTRSEPLVARGAKGT